MSPWNPVPYYPLSQDPQPPSQISRIQIPKELGDLCLSHCTNRGQGPEIGRDLPEVTQQTHQDPGPRGSSASFKRWGALIPHLKGKGEETPGPGGRASVRAGSVPASFSHWNVALSTHTPILGIYPRTPSAALGTGSAPGNPLQAGRSQQAWRLQVQESLPLW